MAQSPSNYWFLPWRYWLLLGLCRSRSNAADATGWAGASRHRQKMSRMWRLRWLLQRHPTMTSERSPWVWIAPAHRGFMNTNIVPDEILTTNDVAALLSVSPRTVEDWRLKGTAPITPSAPASRSGTSSRTSSDGSVKGDSLTRAGSCPTQSAGRRLGCLNPQGSLAR